MGFLAYGDDTCEKMVKIRGIFMVSCTGSA